MLTYADARVRAQVATALRKKKTQKRGTSLPRRRLPLEEVELLQEEEEEKEEEEECRLAR
jgi:hypothetical protein